MLVKLNSTRYRLKKLLYKAVDKLNSPFCWLIRTKIRFQLPFLLIILVYNTSVFSQENKQWLKREFPYAVIDGKLWLGTPKGLYQYFPEEDTWTVYGIHNGLPSNNIQILFWDGEFLWVSTPGGIASGDIRLNKWMEYTTANGLPSNKIYSVTSQDDYIWIGTDKGAARFDKIIQEWELFSVEDGLPDSIVYDIAVEGEKVYFGTAGGLSEYDINFEKWRYYGRENGIASDSIKFIYQTTDFLWLFTDKGPARFNKKLHTALSFTNDARLFYSNILDMKVYNNQYWLATSDGVVIYDPGNNMWRSFQEEVNLPSRYVSSLSFSQQQQWFITSRGVALFDSESKTWQKFDKTHGLSSLIYQAGITFSDKLFLVNSNFIDYYNSNEKRWYVFPLRDMSGIDLKKKSGISLDRVKGSFIQLNPQLKLSISGSRFNFRNQQIREYSYDNKEWSSSFEKAGRVDFKSQLSLPNKGTVNGFYNNIDFSRVLYGARYKGRQENFIQEINWGDVRYEQGKNNLIPSLGIFGSSFILETGQKTQRYKRSLFTAKGWTGEKTTGFENEFFTGSNKSVSVSLRDIDYLKNTFYLLKDENLVLPLKKGSEKVYVDDGDPLSNDNNTLKNFTLAGITGDFDIFQPLTDYNINHSNGEIRFLRNIGKNSTVIVTAASGGINYIFILKDNDTINKTLVNRYFVGGMDIIPYSFDLKIYDSFGNEHPVSEFGLDNNGDGKVDPEWINYKDGILLFSKKNPFPLSVYDVNNPQSEYKLEFRFQTEISIFSLKQNKLVRSSEHVIVDGETLTRGQDYVLDYTGGTLLIIKEGIISDDSEIEIRYEYYRDTREKFNLGSIGFGPSDNMQIELNYFEFDKKNDNTRMSTYKGLNFFGEFKWRIKNIDFKLTPEFGKNQGDFNDSKGMHIRTDVSSEKFRLYSAFEKYDDSFERLFIRKFQLGKLKKRNALGVTLYPAEGIDINAGWNKKIATVSDKGNELSEEDINGKVLISKNLYPAVSFSLRKRLLNTDDYKSNRMTIKGDFDYQVPVTLLNKINFRSVRAYGVWKRSYENVDNYQITDNPAIRDKIYDNQYLRFDISPLDRIQVNTYFRGKTVRETESGTGISRPVSQSRKMFVDAVIDRIEGINVSVRYQGDFMQLYPFSGSEKYNLSLSRKLQSSFRIFPGRWIHLLTPFSFELNYQPSWKGYIRNTEQELNWGQKFINTPENKNLISEEKNSLHQIRGEWRPSASFLFYSGFDFYEIFSRNFSSELKTIVRKTNQKIEYKPTFRSLITVQHIYDYENTEDFSNKKRKNSIVWFENRWSEKLHSRVNLSYLSEKKHNGNIEQSSTNLTTMVGITYRIKDNKSNKQKLEIRNDLSNTVYKNREDKLDPGFNSISNSLAVDYFPFSVIILRFRIVSTYRDRINSGKDTLSNMFELRLTAQF